METSAIKVKPYLVEALIFLCRPLSQYSAIVAHICEEAALLEHHDDDGSLNKSVNANSTQAEETIKDILAEKNTTLGNGSPSDDDLALKISDLVTKTKKRKRSFSHQLRKKKKVHDKILLIFVSFIYFLLFNVELRLNCLMQLDIEYEEDLVGSKIRVWWEDDHEQVFYISHYV